MVACIVDNATYDGEQCHPNFKQVVAVENMKNVFEFEITCILQKVIDFIKYYIEVCSKQKTVSE